MLVGTFFLPTKKLFRFRQYYDSTQIGNRGQIKRIQSNMPPGKLQTGTARPSDREVIENWQRFAPSQSDRMIFGSSRSHHITSITSV